MVSPEEPSFVSRMMKKLNNVVTIVMALLIAFSVKHIFFAPAKIVSFDIKATTNLFLKQVASLNIDENQKSAMIKRYNVALDSTIKEYEAKNYIVLVKDAVITNIDDKTADIQMEIAEKMKRKE